MRICLVSREFPPESHLGGIGTYTYKTSAELARLGHVVRVLTTARKPAADYREGDVWVHRIEEPDHHGPVPRSLAHAHAVADAISRLAEPPDIIQACEWTGEAFWYAVQPRRRAPLVTRLATPLFVVQRLNAAKPQYHPLRPGWVIRSIERTQTLRSDGIISPTRALADIVCRAWKIRPERVTIVPTGISPDADEQDDAAALPTAVCGSEYLLYFGRLERRKGVHILGAALPAVLDAYPSLRVVFVGKDMSLDGQPLADVIRTQAGQHADRLIFLPHLPQAELRPIIRAARLVALPSLWENLANTCLEAMQLGRPVIATRGCGFEEVIEDGVSGYLVPPGDVTALTASIIAALRDDTQRLRIGREAARRAREFALDAMVTRLVEYYRQLIGARHSASVPVSTTA